MSQREPLRFEEREIISRELSKDRSARFIANALGARHHSTIAREINRNGGAEEYRAVDASGGPTIVRVARRNGSSNRPAVSTMR
ncbi:hypothetical protein D5S19_03920 [Amycolatopsis panacis]|uniref:Transposase IS30-like HTH domain-containing protein n=1 Tax=Amycolatopsis panacis TaxID=2340917 RepID=A0A419IA19_9PSEU|nr:hypothetical protein D5S19_03920 [Amycolatopsis panacis]